MSTTTYEIVQRYWDDINEGDELTPIVYELTLTKMVQQVSGSQDFYPVHHDTEFARSGGHADMFINTRFTRAAFGRLLGDLVGVEGWIKRLEYAMRRPNLLGDTIRVTGRVTKKYEADGEALLDLDLGIENDRDGVATPGSATVMLPRR
jgi:acyl dehydratase